MSTGVLVSIDATRTEPRAYHTVNLIDPHWRALVRTAAEVWATAATKLEMTPDTEKNRTMLMTLRQQAILQAGIYRALTGRQVMPEIDRSRLFRTFDHWQGSIERPCNSLARAYRHQLVKEMTP